MPDGTQTPTADPDGASAGAGEARAPVADDIAALGELIGIGLKIARAIERRVDEAGDAPPPRTDLNAAAIAYARVARAVRQSILLRDKLAEASHAGRRAAADLGARRAEVKARLTDLVRSVILAEHGDGEQAERLYAEVAERLEDERHGDVLTRPVGEIFTDICKDLGLHPDWEGLAWDLSCAEAAAEGGVDGDDEVEAAARPRKTEPIQIFWLGDDGKPVPAPGHQRYGDDSS